MGLQFQDANGTQRTLTVQDMLTQDFQDAYWDLFKGLHGIRPRWRTSPEDMLRFFDTYEDQLVQSLAEEAEELRQLGLRDGVEYRDWTHYYDERERAEEARWRREAEARQAVLDHRAAFNARGSALPVIEAWEYGCV